MVREYTTNLYIAAEEDNKLTMADFLRSIEHGAGDEDDELGEERVNEAGISSAALKQQLKKLAKGKY